MNRRDVLASLGVVALGGTGGFAAEPDSEGRGRNGIPTVTVEQLAADLKKDGFQWSFLGRQMSFTATVLTVGTAPRVRIVDINDDRFGTAALHNISGANLLKVGDKIKVRGLLVDQWYGVWQIWKYEVVNL